MRRKERGLMLSESGVWLNMSRVTRLCALPRLACLIVFACVGLVGAVARSAEPDDELVKMVVDLIGEKDKDLRAVGFEQVRAELKGSAATIRFAEQLPKLTVEAQVGLISALADRGDAAARPAILALVDSPDESIKIAAVTALGVIGEPVDAKAIARHLDSKSPMLAAVAKSALVRFGGEGGPPAIVALLADSPGGVQVELIEILAARRAKIAVPALLSAATIDAVNGDAQAATPVRAAAMKTLGELADQDALPGMVDAVLKADRGSARDSAERAVAAVCGRVADADQRCELLLAAFHAHSPPDRQSLLPMLGRVGGAAILETVEAAIADSAPRQHEFGIKAICNWPDASVASRLIELAKADAHPEHRSQSLAALIRVAPLPDKRPPHEKLALLDHAMGMCARDDERKQVLRRVRAVRIVESLRYLLPYLDQPTFAETACESIVELAHHRELREPNKAEFHAALDRVKATSKDPIVIDRAHRYQNNQTWTRPAAKPE